MAKLHEQTPDTKSSIFVNVRAHVNGFTTPSLQELRYLITLHGGQYCQYWFHKVRSVCTMAVYVCLPPCNIYVCVCMCVHAQCAHAFDIACACVCICL